MSKNNSQISFKDKRKWANISLIISFTINICLAVLKGITGILIGSMALIADAIDTTNDLLTGFLAFLGLRWSSRPEDGNHHFGHEKGEIFSAIIIAFLLILSGIIIINESWIRFQTGKFFIFNIVGVLVSLISIGGKTILSMALFRISGKINSQSLKAEAKNYRMDIITSIGVLIAIIGAFFGFSILDLIIAVFVSIMIFKTSLGVIREALSIILDEAPQGLEQEVINISKKISGVIDIHQIRARQMDGQRIFVDCHILVNHETTVAEAHEITRKFENAIYSSTLITEILVHIEPDNQPC